MDKKKYKKYIGKENNFQVTVANYLNSLGVLWFHCPNGGSRHKLEAANLKKQGVKSGVPDVLVVEPKGKYIGLAIELKVGYNKPNDNQIEWLNELEKRGYKVNWTNSLDECIDIIDEYLK
jgi:hypothetical protein